LSRMNSPAYMCSPISRLEWTGNSKEGLTHACIPDSFIAVGADQGNESQSVSNVFVRQNGGVCNELDEIDGLKWVGGDA